MGNVSLANPEVILTRMLVKCCGRTSFGGKPRIVIIAQSESAADCPYLSSCRRYLKDDLSESGRYNPLLWPPGQEETIAIPGTVARYSRGGDCYVLFRTNSRITCHRCWSRPLEREARSNSRLPKRPEGIILCPFQSSLRTYSLRPRIRRKPSLGLPGVTINRHRRRKKSNRAMFDPGGSPKERFTHIRTLDSRL